LFYPNLSLFCQSTSALDQNIIQDSTPVQQHNTGNRYLKFKFEHGGILPIDDNPKVNQVLQASSFTGISLSYGWEIKSSSVYSDVYRKPILGIGFMTSTFNNPVIGTPMSFFGYAEIPFSRRTSRLNFAYSLSLGVSFHFNPYDDVDNPENLMISSGINAYVQAGIEARYQVSKNWQAGLGIGYKHFSNGAMKKPNAGINLLPIQISAQYKLENALTTKMVRQLEPYKPSFSFDLYTSSGLKQNNPGEELIYKNLVGAFVGYQFSYKYKLGVGFDLTYSSGGIHRVSGDETAFEKNFSYGIYAGWEWYITDRLYMPINLGFYLHHQIQNSETTIFYERLGVRYLFFNRHLFVGPSLKAHAGTADFIEVNVGWTFHHDKNHYRH
jgi:hypothetical protein